MSRFRSYGGVENGSMDSTAKQKNRMIPWTDGGSKENQVPNMSKAQAERAVPALQAMRNLIEGAPPPQAVELEAWSRTRESMLSQLDNQLRHAQAKLGRAELPRSRPAARPRTGGGPHDRPRTGGGGNRDSGRPRPNRY